MLLLVIRPAHHAAIYNNEQIIQVLYEGFHTISSSAQSKLEFAYKIPSIKGTQVRLHQENNLKRYKSNITKKKS